MIDMIRYIGYLLFAVLIVLVLVKSMSPPRCQKCGRKARPGGETRFAGGNYRMLYRECILQMRENERAAAMNEQRHSTYE